MTNTPQSNQYRTDERAVSEILGAILLFGLAISLVLLLQVTLVPTWNQQVEFSHSERVADDMSTLGTTIERVQVGESAESTTVELGVRYPSRPLFINPSPAEGQLQTVPIGPMTIEGAQASDEVGDYWDGSPMTHETQAVVYTPNYKEFQDAPATIAYEHGTVASSYDHGVTIVRQPRSVVSGTSINLATLTGTVDTSGVDRTAVQVTPMSRSPRTIAVTGNGDDITLTLPTTLPEETWDELLEDELTDGNVVAFEYTPTGDTATVTISLDGSETYELRTALVGVGENPDRTQPSYLDRVAGGGTVVPVGSTDRLTVEVRDQFNAPKSGVPVTYEVISGSGEFENDPTPGDGTYTVTSGANGQTSVVFSPTAPGDIVVEATASLNEQSGTQAEERVRFTMSTATGQNGGGDGGVINPKDPLSVSLESVDWNQGSRTLTMTFENLGSSEREWAAIRVPFTSNLAGSPGAVELDLTPEGKDTLAVEIGGDFELISPSPLVFEGTGSPDASRTVSLTFPQGEALSPGEFVIINVLDTNNNLATYFVGRS